MSLLDTASLIVTPNGVKEGKLYSVIPSDGSGDMSVVRATTATRVNSAGLVELVPYNLLQYSEDLSNAAWTKSSVSVTANSTTAPDGTTTADTVTDTATTGYLFQDIQVSGAGQIVTFSVYAKKTNTDFLNLSPARSGATTYGELRAWFNLSNGTVGTTQNVGAGVVLDTNIENVGNGWYRCSLTGYVPDALAYTLYLVNTNADNSYTSTIGNSRYQWGAQAVEGSTAKDYQKTETRLNIPRLDYSNGTCPSLLVEPQRTNLALYSSSFDNGAWDKSDSSVTANQIASPSGVQDADKLTENSANEIHGLYNQQPYTSITTATASLFFKKGTRKFFSIKLQIGANSYTQVYDSESVTTTSNTSNGLTSVSTSIVDFGNGWVRATLTGTNPSGAADAYTIYCLSNSGTPTFNPVNFNPTYQGTGTDYGYIWGAQLEAGSYPTSYIPTTSASVTRNADVISKTGISSLIGQTEGTVFVDVDVNLSYTQTDMRFINVSDGTSANWYFIGTNFENEFRFYYRAGATTYVTITTALTSGRHKLAFAYKSNDYVAYLDGTQVNNTTTLAVGSTSQIELGNSFGSSIGKEYTNAAALWKTRLTNTQLATLTTL